MHPTLPSLFGELGTSLDSNTAAAHFLPKHARVRRRKDLRWQTRQLDALCSAMDSNAVGYNMWNYNQDNDAGDELNVGEWADGWNGEDFSIVYRKLDGSVGVRCLEAVIVSLWLLRVILVNRLLQRPYPMRVAGMDLSYSFDMFTLQFDLSFRQSDAVKSRTTLVFLPEDLYGLGELDIALSDGTAKYNSKVIEISNTNCAVLTLLPRRKNSLSCTRRIHPTLCTRFESL